MRSRGLAGLVALALVATSACHAFETPPPGGTPTGNDASSSRAPTGSPASSGAPGSAASSGAPGSAASPAGGPGGPGDAPSAAATTAPTSQPTPSPGPILATKRKITYTNRTSVGGVIKLTVTVVNSGKKKAGKITMEIEAIDHQLPGRTPLRGCVPGCRGTKDAEKIAYAEWTGPPAGATRIYQAQLRARKAGTYTFDVRVYVGTVGDYTDDLGSWTVTTVVR